MTVASTAASTHCLCVGRWKLPMDSGSEASVGTGATIWLVLDHDDGQFFRAMEWLMFFFRVTIEVNGFSMVLTTLDHHH